MSFKAHNPLKLEVRDMKVNEKRQRAYRWAKALVAFQNVGAGPDNTFAVMLRIKHLVITACKEETGIELDSYPTEFVKEHERKHGIDNCYPKKYEI